MFAFLRVVVFYLGFAALLTWGMFALGWADALELPGFEGTRAPSPSPPVTSAQAPIAPTVVSSLPQTEPKPQAQFKPEATPEPTPAPKREVVDTPLQPPIPPVAVTAPAARTEVAVARPAVEAPRAPEPPKAAPPPPPPPAKEAKAPEPAAVPVAPPARSPVVAPAPAQSPPRTVDAAPVSPPPAPPRAPAAAQSSPQPAAKIWAPIHRIAGFGPDALVDLLGETRRARDDVACVMFRNVLFKAGTTVYQPRARAEIELIAKVLAENPGQIVEVGSRLGPGRPMATDAKLRTDRSSLVRQDLIALGVAPARLAIDTREAYERVADDVGRVNGGRVQSIGVCLHAA